MENLDYQFQAVADSSAALDRNMKEVGFDTEAMGIEQRTLVAYVWASQKTFDCQDLIVLAPAVADWSLLSAELMTRQGPDSGRQGPPESEQAAVLSTAIAGIQRNFKPEQQKFVPGTARSFLETMTAHQAVNCSGLGGYHEYAEVTCTHCGASNCHSCCSFDSRPDPAHDPDHPYMTCRCCGADFDA